MKLGVFNINFYDRDFKDALVAIKSSGCDAVEIACGGFLTKKHIDPQILLENEKELKSFLDLIDKSGLSISALSCHANMLHPDKKIAESHINDFNNTIKLVPC